MKLQKPKNVTFWVSIVLAVVGLIAYLKVIPAIDAYSFWILLVGFVLLVLGNLVKGL